MESLFSKADFQQTAVQQKCKAWQVEKNYLLFQLMKGLLADGWFFIVKGGFSLSMVHGITQRFSKDVDIQFEPGPDYLDPVKWGRGHNHKKDVKGRKRYFDYLAKELKCPGFSISYQGCTDTKARNAKYVFRHPTMFPDNPLGDAIVLEAGFARTDPFHVAVFSPWILPQKKLSIACYDLAHNFIEKLNVVAHKYDMLIRNNRWPGNFLHHYYDILVLLKKEGMGDFLRTSQAKQYLDDLFKDRYSQDLLKNPAFTGWTSTLLKEAESLWAKDLPYYFAEQIEFKEVIAEINRILAEVYRRPENK